MNAGGELETIWLRKRIALYKHRMRQCALTENPVEQRDHPRIDPQAMQSLVRPTYRAAQGPCRRRRVWRCRRNRRIRSAEAYAVLAALVDDSAQRLDQDVRPRVRAEASISSRDYLVGLGRAGADEGFVHCCHRRGRRAADADRGDTRTAGSFHRSETRHPRCSRAGSTSSTCVRRRRRMVSLRVDCPTRCRSFVEPMPSRWRCGSAMPIRPHMIGTYGSQRWLHRCGRLRR